MIAHASRTCVFLGAALVLSPVPRATAPAGTPHPPPFRHVFILVEENRNYASVIGNPAMPYLNRLADQYGLATQYYANTHPSIGNYFMLTVGKIVTNDNDFSGLDGRQHRAPRSEEHTSEL